MPPSTSYSRLRGHLDSLKPSKIFNKASCSPENIPKHLLTTMNKICDGGYTEQVYNHSVSINEVSKLWINSSFSVPMDQHRMGEAQAEDAKCVIDVPSTWWTNRVKECKDERDQNKNYCDGPNNQMQDSFPRVVFVEQRSVDGSTKEWSVLGRP